MGEFQEAWSLLWKEWGMGSGELAQWKGFEWRPDFWGGTQPLGPRRGSPSTVCQK